MRSTRTALVLAALGPATWLVGPAGAESAPPAEPLVELREAAREALRSSCGRCHDHARPTARPAALRIFDLQEPDWSARVTDEQMDHMVGRFEGFHMPEADRVTVQRFLDAERARRAAGAEH
jgi:hypothetical protein